MLAHTLPSLRRAPIVLRSFPRASRLHTLSSLPPQKLRKHTLDVPLLARGVASSVSGRPASQTPQHAATNIREEVGNAASELAKSIAGANLPVDNVKPTNDTFMGITSAVAQSVPKPVFLFGLAGGLPYIAASGTTVYLAHQAGLAATGQPVGIDSGVALTVLDQALNVQVTYGAVMLSFLGALHWGMEFAGYGGHKGYTRLFLGAVPVLYAWPTLMLAPTSALIAQWIGFTGLWWADLQATNAGWTPKWYSQYRFYLSVLVGTCIIGSLAGTSYYGPVAGHGILSHDLEVIRMARKQYDVERSGTVGGDIEALPAPENAESYVILKKKQHDEGKPEGEEGKNENE
ncbi:hypothetical protein SCHPADRAFT_902885 [Schizopora paradoxa]|uniref:Mnn4-regulates the mannosylphosphorylation n=1 Tax=Schizopora paradoxa TaxID=27342 RepID=A0A0H2SD98_9AGAM|nr:hypothetical protein SCHPADRAFT_902885 [Schizopora paradoxa]